jgi:hypothetical protein
MSLRAPHLLLALLVLLPARALGGAQDCVEMVDSPEHAPVSTVHGSPARASDARIAQAACETLPLGCTSAVTRGDAVDVLLPRSPQPLPEGVPLLVEAAPPGPERPSLPLAAAAGSRTPPSSIFLLHLRLLI